jgi:HTH-type transcriptional regulator/antitoxin HigA
MIVAFDFERQLAFIKFIGTHAEYDAIDALTVSQFQESGMNIKPIRTDEDHKQALGEIERLWDSPPGTDDGDKLDILLALVEKYEDARWPIEEPAWDPVDTIQYAIDELGHTQAELATILSSRSRATEILKRDRALTVEMIHAISEKWKIPASLLVKPYRLRERAD